jgi:hypothetical protein
MTAECSAFASQRIAQQSFTTARKSQRLPFTDGVNSVAHVILGVVTARLPAPYALLAVCLYVWYQLSGPDNEFTDILEFTSGFIVSRAGNEYHR